MVFFSSNDSISMRGQMVSFLMFLDFAEFPKDLKGSVFACFDFFLR